MREPDPSLLEETCDIPLKELWARLAERGQRFSIGTLCRFFEEPGITWKKIAPASEQGGRIS